MSTCDDLLQIRLWTTSYDYCKRRVTSDKFSEELTSFGGNYTARRISNTS